MLGEEGRRHRKGGDGMKPITIDQLIDAEAEMLTIVEDALEAVSVLLQSCGRYSPQGDLEEAMLLMMEISNSASAVAIKATREERQKREN
jgi:hypothetical protein